MNSRPIIAIVVLASVAFLAFELGRRTGAIGNRGHLDSLTAEPRHAEPSEAEIPHLSADQIRTIAEEPFDKVYQVLKQSPRKTLRGYVDEIQKIQVRPQRETALLAFFRTFIQIDPAAAKKMILDLDKGNRWTGMMAVKDAAPPRAMKQLTEVLLTYEPIEISGCSFDFLRDAIDEWSAIDPGAVRDFFEAHSERLEGYAPILVSKWAAYDPDAAKDWVTKVEEARAKQGEYPRYTGYDSPGELQRAWVEGFFDYDRAAATNYLVARSNDKDFVNVSYWKVADLFAESSDKARDFIMRFPKEKQAEILAGVTRVADRTASGAADRTSSPEFIAEWMMKFPVEMWSQSISDVLIEWRYKDTANLFAWMNRLPADTQRTVVSQYHPYMPSDVIDKEFAAVMHVPDAALRNQLVEQVLRECKDARENVLAALERAQLTPEEREYFAGLIPKPADEISDLSEED